MKATGVFTFTLGFDVNVANLQSTISYGGQADTPSQHRHLYSSFLRPNQNLAEKVSPVNKNTVSYFDGVVCLCDSSGRPVGFPDFTSSAPSSTSHEARNITNIYLSPKQGVNINPGLIYGFYDLDQKKFIGTNISYPEYQERNGPQNVYIAVLARDFDGNTAEGDVDTFGFSSLPAVSELRSPGKLICPVYNLKFKNRTAIKIHKPPAYLSKRMPWYVGISSGSFVKNISLDVSKIYNPQLVWLKKYTSSSTSNVDLKLLYDTTSYNQYGWSKLLGKPYVDVLDERPAIIDSRTIKLRQLPLASIHEPCEQPGYFGTNIKPYLFVYTKSEANSNWSLVPFSNIRSYNCWDGTVEFSTSLVPSDDSLIKVSYAVRSDYAPIKVLDGQDVKINPFLYNGQINFDKPIYFYMEPKTVLIVNRENEQKNNNELYEKENVIKMTQDQKMFDPSHPYFNPLNLVLAVVQVLDRNFINSFDIKDLRLRGGGISHKSNIVDVLKNNPQIRSNWDIFGHQGFAYNNGGYVIVQLPAELKQYMSDDSIYSVVASAMTAGVSFDIQDYTGKEWSKA